MKKKFSIKWVHPQGELNPGLWVDRQISNPLHYEQGRWNRWSNSFTRIQSFYYRQILSILFIWRRKFFLLHRKKSRSEAPDYEGFKNLVVKNKKVYQIS